MKIDRQVEARRPQTCTQREIVEQAPYSSAARRDDDLVQVRIVDDDRRMHGVARVGHRGRCNSTPRVA